MGKSNNVYNKTKKFYERENNLNDFLKSHEIQKLENFNDFFINEIIIKISNFVKSKVQLISYTIKIKSYDSNKFIKKEVTNFKYINILEIKPYEMQSIVIFSPKFLPVMIDLLFGSDRFFKNSINEKNKITFTEFSINEEVVQFIIRSFSHAYRKIFSQEIDLMHIKVKVDLKEPNINFHKMFTINCFNLIINDTKVFFSILIPLSIITKINKVLTLKTTKNVNSDTKKNVLNNISLNDISDLKLNIIAKIINISLSYDKIRRLSVGDILSISKPDKVIGFVEKKPLFIGIYKRFNKQSIVFIKEFIDFDLDV